MKDKLLLIWKHLKPENLQKMWLQSKWIWQYGKRYWKSMVVYTLLGIAGSGVSLVSSFISKDLIDIITGHQTGKLLSTFAAMIGFSIANILFSQASTYASTFINLKVDSEIKNDIFAKMLVTDWESLTDYHTGDLVTRWSSDASNISSGILNWIPNLVIYIFRFISALSVVLYYDPTFALLQQLWDKLRRKVNDVQGKLPSGAGTSIVNDDFGDVLGVFYGLTGESYTYRELEDQAKLIKDDLLKVKDVAKVEIYGIQTPVIDIRINPTILSNRGITTADIKRAFDGQNKVVDAGSIRNGETRIRIESTGNFYSLDDIRNLTIVSHSGEHFRLGDIARIEEGYQTPPQNFMRINNKQAVGIAISTIPTGNVVDMAKAVKKRIQSFSETMPKGFELTSIYDQGYESAVANQGFILNLIISVVTVVAIVLFFIGFKNGLLIGSGLVFSIFATLIVMFANGIALQRMSLAAIIIAMGMLVDNAIVVSDSALVNMQRGMRKRIAIMRACSSTALPLLAATAIAILTFLPIYYSPHITGELLSSLVIVIGVSLMFSWVFALTQTPFFIQEFVRRPRPDELTGELFSGKYYDYFRSSLRLVIKYRYATVGILSVLLVISAWSFQFIPKVFVPSLDKQYFTLDMWLPEGTAIEETDRYATDMAESIQEYSQTEMVSSYIGRTPPRYYLSNVSFGPQPNYAQLLVKCKTSGEARELHALLQDSIRLKYPEPLIKVNKFELSQLTEALIEARFLGPTLWLE